jgi:hypothetical protein
VEKLAHALTCRHCAGAIYVALCTDGRWRAFDRTELPAGTAGSWAWRKRLGMEETDLAPGHPLHYCLGHHGYGLDHRAYRQIVG